MNSAGQHDVEVADGSHQNFALHVPGLQHKGYPAEQFLVVVSDSNRELEPVRKIEQGYV